MIGESEYQAYKAICIKVNVFGSASVENNEILSKKVKKPIKWIDILGSEKLVKGGEEIGILCVVDNFWVFPLN